MLPPDNKTIKLCDMACIETVIRSTGTDGAYRKFNQIKKITLKNRYNQPMRIFPTFMIMWT